MFSKVNFIQRFFVLCLCSAVVLLSGCSSVTDLSSRVSESIFGRENPNPPEALQEYTPKQIASVLWQFKVGPAGNFEYSPKYDAGYIYASSSEGNLYKIDETSGTAVWKVSINDVVSGGVGVGGGLVMVGTQKGILYAYNLDGKPLWKSSLSSEVLSAPVYFDDIVVVRTGDSKVYGISATDGSRKWVYNRRGPSLSLRSSAGVVVDGGAAYAGFAGGKLIALRADNGKLLWEATVAQPKGVTEIERIADITSDPVIDGSDIYATAYQGKVASIDRLTGQVKWSRLLSSLNGLNVENGRIYVSQTYGSVYSLGNDKGKSYWRQGRLQNRQLTRPLPMGNVIAVGDVEGYIHLLDTDEGAFVGRLQVGESPIMPIMEKLSDTAIVVQSRDGILSAIAIQ